MIVQNATVSGLTSYTENTKAGRDYADDLYKAIHQGLSAPEFGVTLRHMIERGEYGGFEIGFAFRLHELLLATVQAPSG